jgi:hypothetical protein
MAKMKLLDKKKLIGAAQGALWAGLGMSATAWGGGYLRNNIAYLGRFADTPTKRAMVDAATGLILAGLVGSVLGRGKKGRSGAVKAAAYMGTGALLATVYPIVASNIQTMTSGNRAGGRRRLGPTVTQALPSASAAPSTSMLRAGGQLVMGAPAIDADAASAGLAGRPGGRYINPRFQWAGMREL